VDTLLHYILLISSIYFFVKILLISVNWDNKNENKLVGLGLDWKNKFLFHRRVSLRFINFIFILYSEDFIGYNYLNIEIFLLYLALAGGDKKIKIDVKH